MRTWIEYTHTLCINRWASIYLLVIFSHGVLWSSISTFPNKALSHAKKSVFILSTMKFAKVTTIGNLLSHIIRQAAAMTLLTVIFTKTINAKDAEKQRLLIAVLKEINKQNTRTRYIIPQRLVIWIFCGGLSKLSWRAIL